MISIINKINNKVSELSYLELSILSFNGSDLSIVGSEDSIYYHNFEIKFINVHTLICNKEWKLDTSKILISIIEGNQEAYDINTKFRVIQGNTIFRLESDDNLVFYVIAENLMFSDEIVKYHNNKL